MKRVLFAVVGVVALLAAVVLVRATRLSSRQVEAEPASLALVDAPAAAERLAKALTYQSISHQDPAQLDAEQFRALHAYLAAQFPLAHAQLQREVVNGYSLLYTWPGRDRARKPIVLLAHLDVVPVEPGTEGGWSYPPFGGQIAEGFVWGRGSLDDKINVLALLEAVEGSLRTGFTPQSTVYLAFGHDEEIGGEEGAMKIAALLKSRGVQPEMVLDEGGTIVGPGIVPGIRRPLAVIGIAEKGSVSVELTVRGEGGHSSSPPAQTAIGILSTAVHKLESNQMPIALRGATQQFFQYVGPEMPFTYRAAFANLWLFQPMLVSVLTESPATNASLRTTTAATIIEGGMKENVLPKTAHAVVNFRILPGDSVASVEAHVRQVIGDARVEVSVLPGAREPTGESPTDNSAFAALARTIRQVFPEALVAPFLTVGGTDSRNYEILTPNVYRFMPFVADQSDLNRLHGTDERVGVEPYGRAVQFYMQLLRNVA